MKKNLTYYDIFNQNADLLEETFGTVARSEIPLDANRDELERWIIQESQNGKTLNTEEIREKYGKIISGEDECLVLTRINSEATLVSYNSSPKTRPSSPSSSARLKQQEDAKSK